MAKPFDISITCPKCYEGTLIITYDPGDPGVRYYPDGSGEPPTQGGLDHLTSSCECWPGDVVEAILEKDESESEVIAGLLRIVEGFTTIAAYHEALSMALSELFDDDQDWSEPEAPELTQNPVTGWHYAAEPEPEEAPDAD